MLVNAQAVHNSEFTSAFDTDCKFEQTTKVKFLGWKMLTTNMVNPSLLQRMLGWLVKGSADLWKKSVVKDAKGVKKMKTRTLLEISMRKAGSCVSDFV